jgi:hypothetical protein
VNGGGGGSGGAAGGKNGDDGHDSDAMPAAGGAPTMTDHGGNGRAGGTADCTDGVNATSSGAGGGGGAGRIRINTTTGQASLTGATLSPTAATSCLTQGMLKK